jgi:sugar phosphate isomerase/epimerase
MQTAIPSVQLYSVRHEIQKNLAGTLAKLAKIGFTQVELFDFVARATEYKRSLSENSLAISSAHAIMMGQDLEPIFDAAADLGISSLIDPYLSVENWQTRAQIEHTAGQLSEIAEKAKAYGIKIGYHNHDWELATKVEGKTALEVFGSILPANIFLEVDLYWVEVGHASAFEILTKLGDRVQFLHIKDGAKSGETKEQVPAGQGEIALAAGIKAAPHAVPIAEFDEYQGDIYDGLAQSLAFIKRIQSE